MGWMSLMYAVLTAAFAPSQSAEGPYFRDGVFDQEDREVNDSTAQRYTRFLHAMGEPSLWKLSRDDHAVTTYRLLWLPSFHSPVSVRIVRSGKSTTLHVVRLDGTGGGAPGKVSYRHTKKLTEDEWARLRISLDQSGYWKMRTSIKTDLGMGLVVDGDHLICEGAEGGRYQIVDRSDPEPDYEKLCRFMLDLSGLDVKATWAEYHCEDVAPR